MSAQPKAPTAEMAQGNLWESALEAWLEDEKEALKKQREGTENRKAQEQAQDADLSSSKRKRKVESM